MLRELEDYKWFPKILRRFQGDYIGSLVKWFNIYQPLTPVLQELVKQSNTGMMQDLCSGSGLPAVYVMQRLQGVDKLILSDKYPLAAFKDTSSVEYLQNSTDVLLLEPQNGICYTMFNSFHHFTTAEQKHLIDKLISEKCTFLFAEILEPSFLTGIKIFLTTTLLQLVLMPFVRPFNLLRLCFTYIFPLNIFTITYDGLLSVIRSKTVTQYQLLPDQIKNSGFEISIFKINNVKGGLVCIKGRPI